MKMKTNYTNQRGFTLVEIMMVVIIIGILAVLAIPRYQKYLLESKLSEVQVNFGEIKQGMAKFYNSHGQKYTDITDTDELEKKLRIELGAKSFFDYAIRTYGSDGSVNNEGYIVRAQLTAEGQDEFNFIGEARCIWFIYPPENRPKDASGEFEEKWFKGWNDEEFFDTDLNPGDEEPNITDIGEGGYAVSALAW
jgi:prepilin-type N-terminal cleavage/methylation domain-containing protein